MRFAGLAVKMLIGSMQVVVAVFVVGGVFGKKKVHLSNAHQHYHHCGQHRSE